MAGVSPASEIEERKDNVSESSTAASSSDRSSTSSGATQWRMNGYTEQYPVPPPSKAPWLKYEPVAWFFIILTLALAIVDRFTTNVWPREGFHIGAGTAGSDFKDGLKPGPWSVQLYDILARVSGRQSIVSLNVLFFSVMHSLFAWATESFVGRNLIDMGNSSEANRRIHKWNGIAIVVLTLLHVWTILAPPIFHGWNSQVVLGNFEWPLSERNPPGTKDVNVETMTVSLQGDDVFRLVEMTILLAILMPLSVRWLVSRYHVGIHLHNLISVMYFIDIVRRHTHPHSWVLNTPFFVAWLVDLAVGRLWRTEKPQDMRVVQLSDQYMLLFWKQNLTSRVVGAKFYLKLTNSSWLERAHVFTGFENRRGYDMADGFDWSTALLVRVYDAKRCPPLSRKERVSHTHRIRSTLSEDLNGALRTWGPFVGGMSQLVYRSLYNSGSTTLVAGGSAAGYCLDALQMYNPMDDLKCQLTILYTTRDAALLSWLAKWVNHMLHDMVTMASGDVTVLLAFTGDPMSLTETDRPEKGQHEGLRLQVGRLKFSEEIRKDSGDVFFQGSGGLQRAVHEECKRRGLRFVAGPAYDQEKRKSAFSMRLRKSMNCFGEP